MIQREQSELNIDANVFSANFRDKSQENVVGKNLLTQKEALVFLREAKSIGEGINRISEIYSTGEAKRMVITFSFARQGVGFTNIMVKEGFLQLLYDGTDSEGFQNYNESEIVLIENKDLAFRADDYRFLKMLADSKINGE